MSQIAPNPYGAPLGDREPLEALGDTPGKIRALVDGWTDAEFERSYAAGKWSARQILIHLAQTELALTTRARYALSQDGTTRSRSHKTTGSRSTAAWPPGPH